MSRCLEKDIYRLYSHFLFFDVYTRLLELRGTDLTPISTSRSWELTLGSTSCMHVRLILNVKFHDIFLGMIFITFHAHAFPSRIPRDLLRLGANRGMIERSRVLRFP
jgi:hypothetical protein